MIRDLVKEIEEDIFSFMGRKKYKPLIPARLSDGIARRGHPLDLVADVLDELESSGAIVRTKDGRIALPRQVNRYVGRLSAHPDGFGFVQTPDEDIYVSGRNLYGAMHNDKVAVSLSKRARGRSREGTVVEILERANTEITAVLKHTEQGFCLVPLNRRIFYTFVVPPKLRGGAGVDDIVRAKLIDYPKNPRMCGVAEVLEILGSESDPTIAVDVVISEHGFKTQFPPDVVAESNNVSEEVGNKDIEGRTDCRTEFTVTIDGLDAKDFDDAVGVREVGDGYILKVHIADVSAYVRIGSALDREAKHRGFSVYLPDRVIPMLPEKLSNQICSLNPKVDRLTLTAEMRIDQEGRVKKSRVYDSVIRSKARLTYEQVDEAIETGNYPDAELARLIELLLKVSKLLEKRRIKRGSIEFETIEPKIVFGPDGAPTGVELRRRTPATQIIEECMIAANESVAWTLHRKNVSAVYRIHDIPDEDQMKDIAIVLKELEIPVRLENVEVEFGKHQRSMQKIIGFVHGRPEDSLINNLLLRAMKQARYSHAAHSHYGLAAKHYTHFTSPIRRYPDLIVHRLVKHFLVKGDGAFKEDEITELEKQLGEICERCSISEREADSAEREAKDALLCLLLVQSVGEVFEGVITGVTDFGIFVQLPNSAEGLIRLQDMKSDFFRYESEHYRVKGDRTGVIYKLGEKVRVKITRVNVLERKVDLMLDEDAAKKTAKPRRKAARR